MQIVVGFDGPLPLGAHLGHIGNAQFMLRGGAKGKFCIDQAAGGHKRFQKMADAPLSLVVFVLGAAHCDQFSMAEFVIDGAGILGELAKLLDGHEL
jgi:hypothetical protein